MTKESQLMKPTVESTERQTDGSLGSILLFLVMNILGS